MATNLIKQVIIRDIMSNFRSDLKIHQTINIYNYEENPFCSSHLGIAFYREC